MEGMKVLLVNPASAAVYSLFGLDLPPIGLLYLAAALEKAGHAVSVWDAQIEGRHPLPADLLGADLVGIGSDTTRIGKALAIARKASSCGIPVVLGGPHAQFAAEPILDTGHVDYIACGEGEEVIVRLADAIESGTGPAGVPGLLFRDGDRTVATPPLPPPDVEALPFPARHLVDLGRYVHMGGRRASPVVTSRGCPGRCSFCSSSTFFGGTWRARSVDSVLAEIDELYHRFGVRAVAFVDDNFTLSPSRVVALSEGIARRGHDLKWWAFSRVDTVARNPGMVDSMAAAGCFRIYLGIESGSDETLARLGKRTRSGDAAVAVRVLRDRGIEVHGSYIIGAPGEGREDVERTIELAIALDTDIGQFSILTPYPGTALSEELSDRVFTRRWKHYDGLHLVFRHPRMNRYLLQSLLVKAYVRFYRRSRESLEGFMNAGRRAGLGPRRIAAGLIEFFF